MSHKIRHHFVKDVEYKYCSRGKHWVDINQFSKNKSSYDGVHNYCKTCNKEYVKTISSYKNKRPEQSRKKSLKYTKNLREQFFGIYGKSCKCCGESNLFFLTLEHKNGQKGVKYKESGATAYRKAIQEYRPDLYEVLCYNCNCAKGKYGKCPHQM